MASWSLLTPVPKFGASFEPEEFDFTLPVITLDATLVEKHSLKASLTRFPIERSAEGEEVINDHITQEPDDIMLEGIITNTPIDEVSSALIATQSQEVLDRVRKTYAELERLMRRGTVFTVTTGLKIYTSMVITEVTTTRRGGAESRQSIRPQIRFEKATFTNTVRVPIPAEILAPPPAPPDPPPSSHTSGQTKQKLEKQAKKTANQSAADRFVEGAANLATSFGLTD